MYAIWNGHMAVVGLLLRAGARIDLADDIGGTAVSYAVCLKRDDVLKLLFDKGTKASSMDDTSTALLLSAAEKGHEAVVNLLLETGRVHPDPKDSDGRTPLWQAASNGHEAVVRLLLATGRVNPDSKDNNSLSVLFQAAENGHEAVVKLLLERGADPGPKTKDDRPYKSHKLVMRSSHVPQSQPGDFVPAEVENKQNPAMDSEVMQTEPPTDSGYASGATGRNNISEDAQSDDIGTVYSDASSLPAWDHGSYISELANSLLHEIRSEQPDDTTLEQISQILPELLKAFALKVGHNASTQMHRDVMFFIHKHRR
jgi:ankyrin repeat protein